MLDSIEEQVNEEINDENELKVDYLLFFKCCTNLFNAGISVFNHENEMYQKD